MVCTSSYGFAGFSAFLKISKSTLNSYYMLRIVYETGDSPITPHLLSNHSSTDYNSLTLSNLLFLSPL